MYYKREDNEAVFDAILQGRWTYETQFMSRNTFNIGQVANSWKIQLEAELDKVKSLYDNWELSVFF